MKRSVVFAGAHSFPTLVDLSRQAEAAGFHRVWTTENHSRDGMLRAAVIALHTATIGIGTGIAYAFTRAPLAMATAAAEIQVLAGGRFTLGLGAMTRGMRRNWYGLEVDHPAPRLKEYAQLVRAALRAEDGFTFSGRFYSAAVPTFDLVGDRALIRSMPVYGSGVNAVMLRACAESCDGVALHSIAAAPAYFDRIVAPALAHAPSPLRLAVWRLTAVHADADVARAAARRNIAFYLATPSYRAVGEGRPWEERVGRIQELFRAAGGPLLDWTPLEALVSDEMIDELALAGTPAEVRARAASIEAELERRGADEIVFQPVETAAAEPELRAGMELLVDALRPPRTAPG